MTSNGVHRIPSTIGVQKVSTNNPKMELIGKVALRSLEQVGTEKSPLPSLNGKTKKHKLHPRVHTRIVKHGQMATGRVNASTGTLVPHTTQSYTRKKVRIKLSQKQTIVKYQLDAGT